jgi:cytochrome c
MKRIVLSAIVVFLAIIGSGCGDSKESTSATKPAPTQPAAVTPAPTPTPVKPAAVTPAQPAATQPAATTPTPTPVKPAATAAAKDGVTLFKSCVACHGVKADKPGMNKGRPPATLSKDEIITALKGYKAGTNNAYGSGGLMKGNMAPFSEKDIETVAAHIKTLK